MVQTSRYCPQKHDTNLEVLDRASLGFIVFHGVEGELGPRMREGLVYPYVNVGITTNIHLGSNQ